MGIQLNGTGGIDVISAVDGTLTIEGTSTVATPIVTNNISISDKIIHTGDTDTAIRFPGANTVSIETSGTPRLNVTSAGRIGINEDTPIGDLHVTTSGSSQQDGVVYVGGDAAAVGLKIEYDQASNTVAKIFSNATYTNTSALLHIGVDGDANPNQLVLKGDGKIGIGIANPSNTLSVVGSDTPPVYIGGANPGIKFEDTNASGTPLSYIYASDGQLSIRADDGDETGSSLIEFKVDGSEKVRITSDGKVGIGEDSPDSLLHLRDKYDGGASESNLISISRRNGGANDATIRTLHDGSDGIAALTLKLASAERLRINSTGHVCIGESNFTASNDVHIKRANSGGDVAIRITNNTNTNSGSTASLYFTTSPTQDFNTAYIKAVRDGGKLNFGYATNNPAVCMQVSTGDVGIGTETIPGDSKLHLWDSSTSNYRPVVIDSAATNGSVLEYKQLGTSVIRIGSGGANNLSGSNVTHGLIRSEVATVFAVGNSEKMRITSTGADVSGTLNLTGDLYWDGDTDTNISNASTANWMRFKCGGDVALDLTNNADVKIHDDKKLKIGSSDDIQIFHNSGNDRNYFFSPQHDVYHEFNVGNSWTVATTAGDKRIVCQKNSTSTAVELYWNGAKQCETATNGLKFPSGKGINFSATSDAGGMTNELLDDYEEGSWTPKLYAWNGVQDQGYDTQTGNYVKIGNQIFANFVIDLSSKGTVSGNYTFIAGLPYIHAGVTGGSGTLVTWGWAMGSNIGWIAGDISSTNTVCWVTYHDNNNNNTGYLPASLLYDNSQIKGTLIYRSA